MKLTRDYSRLAAVPGWGQESYLQRKIDPLMVEVETMHSSAGNLYNGLKNLLGIMQEMEKKHRRNFEVNERMQNLSREHFRNVEQLYLARVGPDIQELYDIFYDELVSQVS